ncbi:hypothetical protein BU23DRAFT_569264 [Bimuria novae-zelandiae CBS 107.79]|uniref:Uncharacterized protein n=1 Tax=Bimuria novae-zelandiae CBS 107.79 TaxID=1447943 RepID=A0A6A5V7L2_9PLEO|nr:hypothetical protein BU23DRAFT_569264 [Bimuria novae-zelandiae CBS 107.79]
MPIAPPAIGSAIALRRTDTRSQVAFELVKKTMNDPRLLNYLKYEKVVILPLDSHHPSTIRPAADFKIELGKMTNGDSIIVYIVESENKKNADNTSSTLPNLAYFQDPRDGNQPTFFNHTRLKDEVDLSPAFKPFVGEKSLIALIKLYAFHHGFVLKQVLRLPQTFITSLENVCEKFKQNAGAFSGNRIAGDRISTRIDLADDVTMSAASAQASADLGRTTGTVFGSSIPPPSTKLGQNMQSPSPRPNFPNVPLWNVLASAVPSISSSSSHNPIVQASSSRSAVLPESSAQSGKRVLYTLENNQVAVKKKELTELESKMPLADMKSTNAQIRYKQAFTGLEPKGQHFLKRVWRDFSETDEPAPQRRRRE